jgi:hypothetical protein
VATVPMEMVQASAYVDSVFYGSPEDVAAKARQSSAADRVADRTIYYASGDYAFTISSASSSVRIRAVTRSKLLDRTVIALLVLASMFLVIDFLAQRLIFDISLMFVMYFGALGLRVTDAIVKRDFH